MRSALSRNHSTNSPSHKAPRKSSSFLSLKREKDKSSTVAESSMPYDREVYASSATPPSSYVDVNYPQASRNEKPKSRQNSLSRAFRSSKTATTAAFAKSSGTAPESSSSTGAYTFPSFDSTEDLATPTPYRPAPNQYTRTRSRTGPSGRSRWDAIANVPSLRFSGSSTQHTDTPPRTPEDYTGSTESLEQISFPSVVSAPIPGVEIMDALVDGMNGGSSDLLSDFSLSNRSRFGIPNHHPLYQPPLPTPPPGVILSRTTKNRKYRPPRKSSISSSSSDEQQLRSSTNASYAKTRRAHPTVGRSTSNVTITPKPSTPKPTQRPTRPSTSPEVRKSVVPSISEIIRTHAPPEVQSKIGLRSSSLYSPSQGHSTVHEEPESEPEALDPKEEAELMSRSSIDSVADEVQRTLRIQNVSPAKAPTAPPSAFARRQSTFSDNMSIYSPRSDPGANASSYSSSVASLYSSQSPLDAGIFPVTKPSAQQEVAQYLRSTRLTTMVKLTRQPHASQEDPLTVSFSDLGSPDGHPVVVFLGLGCVRHIMGLYDEMAECLGLRLITIDRWGLGRTDARPKSSKGIIQWASAVEEVLDLLRINECSIMAHSAGAPYALSFANKVPSRIRGDVCLLAPWVGGSENSGYRWLKYIPNGILRTAQAAEWKLQAWMIGKPPTIAYEGIGYTAPQKESSRAPAKAPSSSSLRSSSPKTRSAFGVSLATQNDANPRPSFASSTFSEYDDLRDFDGKFDSRSTLGVESRSSIRPEHVQMTHGAALGKRKVSKGFLDRLKTAGSNRSDDKPDAKVGGTTKKLKGLRSMGSLKGKSRKADPPSPSLPPTLRIEVGLGLDDGWSKSLELETISTKGTPVTAAPSPSSAHHGQYLRANGHRSVSLTSSKPSASLPSSPSPSIVTTSFAQSGDSANYQGALGNALIAASHAESAKGTHNDLLQILNHDNQPWGFSYAAYPHDVRVWYGDKDEKIAENAVRWMERTMGSDRCAVKVVKGADHGLMYRSSVVVDVLEWVAAAWRDDVHEAFAGLRS